MIKTILIDDEPRGLSSLKKMIELHCPDLHVIGECPDAHSAIDQIRRQKPKLIFLDISMPEMNGFELLNQLKDVRPEVIFVTAHNEYAIQAFKYSAVDYLLKPVDELLLGGAVKRAISRMASGDFSVSLNTFLHNMEKQQRPAEMKLCISSQKGFQVIDLMDVIYCEGQNSYTSFLLTNGTQLIASKSIIEYELLLADNFFCRVHKSYLINLAHVKEYLRGEGGSVILTNGQEVEVSRRKKELFLSRIKDMFKS